MKTIRYYNLQSRSIYTKLQTLDNGSRVATLVAPIADFVNIRNEAIAAGWRYEKPSFSRGRLMQLTLHTTNNNDPELWSACKNMVKKIL